MKTKILALVLAMLMLLSLVACNGGNKTGNDETTASTGDQGNQGGDTGDKGTSNDGGGDTVTPEWGSHLPNDTYGDEEFTILFRSNDCKYNDGIYAENKVTNTSVQKAVYERLATIETTYKIKFIADYTSDANSSTMITAISNFSKTGTDPFELFGGHAQGVPWSLAINGNLYEWGDLPLIQLDQPYWSQNAREQFSTPGGKIYFMTGDMSYWTVASAFCMFFNKDIMNTVTGLDSPYDKVRNNEWTWETFSEYVTTLDSNMAGDGSNTLDTDSWGYATSEARGPYQILVSTEYPMLEKDENEKYGYKCNLSKNTLGKAVAAFIELTESGSMYQQTGGLNYTPIHGAFKSNRLAFNDDEVQFASTWTAEGVNFGVLPWPKYDDHDGVYSCMVNAGNDSFGIPINTTAANAQRISVVLENLAYYGTEIVEFYYNVILTYQDFRDEDSIEMMEYIHEGLNFDFGYYYNPGGVCTAALKCYNSKTSLSQWWNTNKGSVNDALEKWIALDKE